MTTDSEGVESQEAQDFDVFTQEDSFLLEDSVGSDESFMDVE